MKQYLKVSASFATVLFLAVGAIALTLTSTRAQAQDDTIEIDGAMLDRCNEEGISGEACACWFDAILASEGLDEISEDEVDELAAKYQDELAACIKNNDG